MYKNPNNSFKRYRCRSRHEGLTPCYFVNKRTTNVLDSARVLKNPAKIASSLRELSSNYSKRYKSYTEKKLAGQYTWISISKSENCNSLFSKSDCLYQIQDKCKTRTISQSINISNSKKKRYSIGITSKMLLSFPTQVQMAILPNFSTGPVIQAPSGGSSRASKKLIQGLVTFKVCKDRSNKYVGQKMLCSKDDTIKTVK
ncbi:unnamed protein product [Moneuplotes crassus]|uniref:Uncharacterized protein n=1 Tax=Euplotes crassus TaxID=5936 RepID=A0AAD2D587_EUPCR|nr:unnamed protein product [Moneuplotes crassus]